MLILIVRCIWIMWWNSVPSWMVERVKWMDQNGLGTKQTHTQTRTHTQTLSYRTLEWHVYDSWPSAVRNGWTACKSGSRSLWYERKGEVFSCHCAVHWTRKCVRIYVLVDYRLLHPLRNSKFNEWVFAIQHHTVAFFCLTKSSVQIHVLFQNFNLMFNKFNHSLLNHSKWAPDTL